MDFKIRSTASLFTLSLPLCPYVFVASYDPCVVSTVENLKKRLGTRQAPERTSHSWRKAKQIRHTSSFSINQRKFSARKDRKNVALIGRQQSKCYQHHQSDSPSIQCTGSPNQRTVRRRISLSAPLSLF